jgi:hypothetical protein
MKVVGVASCDPLIAFATIVLSLAALPGCSYSTGVGTLRAVSLGNQPATLVSDFSIANFADDTAGTSFMLSDVPPEQLIKGSVANAQIMHVELLWEPLPGMTPLDPSATNASIRYIIISNGEVGLYGGAGFAMPSGELTGNTVSLALEDASLQLLESTPGFRDLLSPAQLTGSFSAARDEKKNRLLNMAASQIVTNALGKTRYVQSQPAKSEAQPEPGSIAVR